MKTASTCLALFTALTSFTSALQLAKKSSPAVVGAKTQRKSNYNPIEHDRRRHGGTSLTKRQDTVSASLENEVTLYFIQVSIGTPKQQFELHIDTGSSDLWVNTPNSELCQQYSRYCEQAGVYQSGQSSTYKVVSANAFNVTYADGSNAAGDYVSDTVTVGSATLQTFEFGVASTSNSPEGILGVGYVTNEGSSQNGVTYANLPKAMANAGVINSDAYSLYLDDLDANTGNILFGGVDTSKFKGELTTFPVIASYPGFYSELLIGLTGIGVNGKAGSVTSGQSIAGLLDSGTSLIYLPNDIVSSLYSTYNTQYDSQSGTAPVDCSLQNQDGSVDFTFSSLTISVPLSELVIDVSENPNEAQCAFGIAPNDGSGITVLGDTFLRSAYVVYDLSNNEISMAQASYNTGSSNIQEIQAGSSGVPSAVAVASPVTSVANVVTGAIGQVDSTAIASGNAGSGSESGNAAMPMITPAPAWKIGGSLVAGAAALAML